MTAETTTQRTVWQEPTAVQVRVAIEPPVWRRLVVPLDTTLVEQHHILQAAMGWTNSHLDEFEVGGLSYGDIDTLSAERTDDDARVYDGNEVRLRDFSRKPGTSFVYVYDYGDNWRHTVTLEKLVAAKPAPKTATCIEGGRCCPPEDVGGPTGYFDFLRVLLSPEPDEIEEQRHLNRWSGKFDPDRFDLAKTDKAVRGALRKRRRE
jgi:Plasmid pRiA4b ORF-3-like protein